MDVHPSDSTGALALWGAALLVGVLSHCCSCTGSPLSIQHSAFRFMPKNPHHQHGDADAAFVSNSARQPGETLRTGWQNPRKAGQRLAAGFGAAGRQTGVWTAGRRQTRQRAMAESASQASPAKSSTSHSAKPSASPPNTLILPPEDGFISIDFGYTDPDPWRSNDWLLWYPDVTPSLSLPPGSVPHNITSNPTSNAINFSNPFNYMETTLRAFPVGDVNCMNISTGAGRYLVRMTFWYSNYDGLQKPPTFQVAFGLTSVVYASLSLWLWSSYEFIVDVVSSPAQASTYMPLCLINVGSGVPIINGLELRPLPSTAYSLPMQAPGQNIWYNWQRLSCSGFNGVPTYRYPDDPLDRLWYVDSLNSYTVGGWSLQPPGDYIVTSKATVPAVGLAQNNSVPEFLIQKARTTNRDGLALSYGFAGFTPGQLAIIIYVADIATGFTGPNGTVLSVALNGKQVAAQDVFKLANDRPGAAGGFMLYQAVGALDQTLNIQLSAAPWSRSRRPFISGLELYYVQPASLPTVEAHVSALQAFLVALGFPTALDSWTGDPCNPLPWAGVTCNATSASSVVTTLYLSGLHLQGRIVPELGNISTLQNITLSNNSLTGPVPASIFSIPSLRVLDVSDNNLSGALPPTIPSTVQLNAQGNPNLCSPTNADFLPTCSASPPAPSSISPAPSPAASSPSSSVSSVDIAIAVCASVVGALLLALVLFFFFCYRNQRWRRRATPAPDIDFDGSTTKSDALSTPFGVYGEDASTLYNSLPMSKDADSVTLLSPAGAARPGLSLSGSRGSASVPLNQGGPHVGIAVTGPASEKDSEGNPEVHGQDSAGGPSGQAAAPSPSAAAAAAGPPALPLRLPRDSPVLNFSLQEVTQATNFFSPQWMIGSGGFGPVFRGELENGRLVAVKRRGEGSLQGREEFLNEVLLLSKARHPNLVELIGYCQDSGHQILVYEFMANGTVRDHLYDPQGQPLGHLSWIQRLQIALGAAKGIDYLHNKCRPSIIHRDIKTSNILLDTSLESKVADFGLSRFKSNEQSHVSTNVKGTAGYLDPEYYIGHQLTDKSDVFSFGVVLLELISGRQPVNLSRPRMEWSIIDWARGHLQTGNIEAVIDSTLDPEQYDVDAMWKVAEVGILCVEPMGLNRPCIADVVKELSEAIDLEIDAGHGLPGQKRLLPPRTVEEIKAMDGVDMGHSVRSLDSTGSLRVGRRRGLNNLGVAFSVDSSSTPSSSRTGLGGAHVTTSQTDGSSVVSTGEQSAVTSQSGSHMGSAGWGGSVPAVDSSSQSIGQQSEGFLSQPLKEMPTHITDTSNTSAN